MDILDHAPLGKAAVEPACRNHRKLAGKVDYGFQHCLLFADRLPGGLRNGGRIDAHLAFAVVAEGDSLENCRRT